MNAQNLNFWLIKGETIFDGKRKGKVRVTANLGQRAGTTGIFSFPTEMKLPIVVHSFDKFQTS